MDGELTTKSLFSKFRPVNSLSHSEYTAQNIVCTKNIAQEKKNRKRVSNETDYFYKNLKNDESRGIGVLYLKMERQAEHPAPPA